MLRFIALMAALVAMMATLSLPGHGQLRKGGGMCAQQHSSCLKRCDKTPDRKKACTERCDVARGDCEFKPCAQQYKSCLKRCDKTPDRKKACTERCEVALVDCVVPKKEGKATKSPIGAD